MQRSTLRGAPALVSAKGAFRIAKRRFSPEFLQQVTTRALQVFEIGLLGRFGVVTSLCCPELSRETPRDDRTAAPRRDIGGLEISGTSAGLRGNFLDDSW